MRIVSSSRVLLPMLATVTLGCPREEPTTVAPPAPVRCFQVEQWLEPEICNWAANVEVRGCFVEQGVSVEYWFQIRKPCTPEEQTEYGDGLLRYDHRDLYWVGTLEGAWSSELRRLLQPEPPLDMPEIFVTIELGEGRTQKWHGGDAWIPLLRELDYAAANAVGLSFQREPRSVTLGEGDSIETFEVVHDPSTCTVTLVHRADTTSSCRMPLSGFYALVPDAEAWPWFAEHDVEVRATLRAAARCNDE
jgi:hypothetical protein